jgi:hypothetical protein
MDEIHTNTFSTGCVEDLLLFLPSSLPTTLHPQLHAMGMLSNLLDKEIKLCIAQADDALAEIHRQRRIVTGLVLFKKLNMSGTGQKNNTRLQTLFKRFSNKTERVAERYRAAYRALANVNADGDWHTRLQVLQPEDIRGPGKENYYQHESTTKASEG